MPPLSTNRIFGTPWKPLERPLRTTTTCASWDARNFPGQSWVVIFGDFHGSTQKCMVYNGKSYYNEWGYPHSRTISICTHTYIGAIISMVNDVMYIYIISNGWWLIINGYNVVEPILLYKQSMSPFLWVRLKPSPNSRCYNIKHWVSLFISRYVGVFVGSSVEFRFIGLNSDSFPIWSHTLWSSDTSSSLNPFGTAKLTALWATLKTEMEPPDFWVWKMLNFKVL